MPKSVKPGRESMAELVDRCAAIAENIYRLEATKAASAVEPEEAQTASAPPDMADEIRAHWRELTTRKE